MKQSTILLLTPFRNEEHSIKYYIESLEALAYNHDLIKVYWLENDSSDKTAEKLEKAYSSLSFKNKVLILANILGPVKKRPAEEYYKDLGHCKERKQAWISIWNNYFLPEVRGSQADYVLCWWADAVAPPELITEYLKVFSRFPDAGWVGGSIYRRYPMQTAILSPWPEEIYESSDVVEASLTGHVWMNPRAALAKCEFYDHGRDIHYSLVESLAKQGLKVYYQPSIRLKHVSVDGKIHEVS